MKKEIFLLFLACIIVQYGFTQTSNSDKKFDLIPKIKKGDTYKMVVDIFTDTGTANYNFTSISDSLNLPKSKSLGECYYKSVWEVICLSSSKNRMELSFTLMQLKAQGDSFVPNSDAILFNDSDYPIFEKEKSPRNYIGKSFDYLWEYSDSIGKSKIFNNQFSNKHLSFPLVNIKNDKTPDNYSVNMDIELYNIVGPEIVNIVTTFSRSLLPRKKINIHDKWSSKIEVTINDTTISNELKLELIGQDENNVFIKEEQQESPFLVDKKTGVAFIFPENNSYIYDFPGLNNTNISGDISAVYQSGDVKLDFITPVGIKDTIVKIENGIFNFALDLEESVFAYLEVKGRQFSLYIKPGMQVQIIWNSKNGLPHITGFGSEDMECIMRCLAYYPPNRYQTYHPSIFRDGKNWFEKNIKRYPNKLSNSCLQFLHEDVICQKGFYMVHSMMNYGPNKEYMSYVDSISLLSFNSEVLPNYNMFINEYLVLKQKLIKKQFGGRYDKSNIKDRISFAKLFYKGYPLYLSMYYILKSGLLDNSITEVQKYYDEFLSFPVNEKLKTNLRILYSGIEKIKTGYKIPITSYPNDSLEVYELQKGNFTIVDIHVYEYSYYNHVNWGVEKLIDDVSKDNIIKGITLIKVVPASSKGKFKEIKGNKKINIKYIYLPKDKLKILEALKLNNQRRVFFLDPELIILDNNFDYTNLKKVLDNYFESKIHPSSHADTLKLLLIILLSLIGFGLLSWIVIRTRTKQISKHEAAKRKLIELELRAIRSQMNPHFMFNSLTSIQNLINKNKIEETNIYLSQFAELMRLVLNNSEKQLVLLEEELQLIRSYLDLEKLRTPFKYEIYLDPSINIAEEEIPAMLIQPFVENAVIHGIAPQKGGVIKISFTKKSSKIICEISDDGIGISRRKTQRKGNGKAIKMVKERLKIINSRFEDSLTLEIIDRKEMNEKGTLVRIKIPV